MPRPYSPLVPAPVTSQGSLGGGSGSIFIQLPTTMRVSEAGTLLPERGGLNFNGATAEDEPDLDYVTVTVEAVAGEDSLPLDVATWFGDGGDGNVTVSTPIVLTQDMYYDNLTLNVGGSVNPYGWRIFVRNTLTFNGGQITLQGGHGRNGFDSSLRSLGGESSTDGVDPAIPVGLTMGTGQRGGDGFVLNSFSPGTNFGGGSEVMMYAGGGSGGSGGKGGDRGIARIGGPGGAGAPARTRVFGRLGDPMMTKAIVDNGVVAAGMGGGGGGKGRTSTDIAGSDGGWATSTNGAGGGGGQGGNGAYVAAKKITFTGLAVESSITTIGGNGGAGNGFSGSGQGGGGAGGGGGGGYVVIVKAETEGSRTNAFTSVGGSGGTGGAGSGGTVGSTSYGFGGAGGAGGDPGSIVMFTVPAGTSVRSSVTQAPTAGVVPVDDAAGAGGTGGIAALSV